MTPQSAATVFRVSDLDASLAQYRDLFGFSEEFRFGHYAGIKRGAVSLHLADRSDFDRPIGGGTIYVFCDAVDGYYAELKAKGAAVKSEPKDYPYGMRDFTVADRDGNQLSFGCEISATEK